MGITLKCAAAAVVGLMVTSAFAHGGGMGGGGMGGMSGMHGNFGGQSASHMSAQGLKNTNGPNAADRDFGRARAEDRMSAQGLAHSKAGMHHSGSRHASARHASTHHVGQTAPSTHTTNRVTSI